MQNPTAGNKEEEELNIRDWLVAKKEELHIITSTSDTIKKTQNLKQLEISLRNNIEKVFVEETSKIKPKSTPASELTTPKQMIFSTPRWLR